MYGNRKRDAMFVMGWNGLDSARKKGIRKAPLLGRNSKRSTSSKASPNAIIYEGDTYRGESLGFISYAKIREGVFCRGDAISVFDIGANFVATLLNKNI